MNNRIAVVAALPEMLAEIEEVNQKWHVDADGNFKPHDQEFNDRCILLMTSELMEAFESIRKKNGPDSHLPQYPGESVEMTDLFIRSLDFMIFAENGRLVDTFRKVVGDQEFASPLLETDTKITLYAVLLKLLASAMDDTFYVAAIADFVIDYCDHFDIPLMEIYRAKMDYNKTRADHKPEARAQEGGKQF